MGKNGGFRENSGRKKIIEKISNYQRAISLLDDNVINAIETLLKLLKSKNSMIRLKACEILLKKILPDKMDLQENNVFRITFED